MSGSSLRDFWETRYAQEDGGPPPPTPFGRRAAAALEVLREGLGRAPEVLELGAGSGRDAAALAATGAKVVALDFAEAGVRALARIPEVTAVRADLVDPLPFPDAAFDVVYSHLVLSCAFRDDVVQQIVDEVHRVLRPGGRFWLAVRSTDDPIYRLGPQRGPGYCALGDTGLHFFSSRSLRRFLVSFQLECLEPGVIALEDERYGVIEAIACKSTGQDG